MTMQEISLSGSSDQHFIFRKGLQPTLAFLKSYQELGSLVRTYMLKEHDAMFQKLRAGVDHFASYSQQQKDHVEVLIYIELLERLCLIIEDLAKPLYALSSNLETFLESILTSKNPQNILNELDNEKWNTILRYTNIDSLPISGDDKLFLNGIRRRNIERLSTIIGLCIDFLELQWPFFIRHKHGNTILYGLGSADINGVRSFMVPAVFNRKHPDKMKGVFVNESIYQKWQVFLNGLIQMAQWLVERTIVFIETEGKGFAEYDTYFPLQQEEKIRLENILKICNADKKRANVILTVQASIEPQLVQKFNDFYKKFDSLLIKINATAANSNKNVK